MKKAHNVSIRVQLLLLTVACAVIIGLVGILSLYRYSRQMIESEESSIRELSAEIVSEQVNYVLERVEALELYCVSSCSTTIAPLDTQSLLSAQSSINDYLRASQIDRYINKLLVFSEDQILLHVGSQYDGAILDHRCLTASAQYQDWLAGGFHPYSQVYPSINRGGHDCFVLFSQIYSPYSGSRLGCVYMEVDTAIITDILTPYNQQNLIFVETASGDGLIPETNQDFFEARHLAENPNLVAYQDTYYDIETVPLSVNSLTLSYGINQTAAIASQKNMALFTISILVLTICTTVLVMATLSQYITKPIDMILDKINRIAFHDYSPTPELEQMNYEMGKVGAQLNQMGIAIQNMLDETIALHDQRQKIEMALLQSQVNPHFLYNTLNSVLWMAVAQKNTGIESLVRSLVNLLKNVSKGVSDHILLSEELSLLKDYINIQSIRYIDDFEFVCNVPEVLLDYRIPKFTLQPLIENAIFHGIIPKETFGAVTVDAQADGDDILLTVTDDGVGMTPVELERVLSGEHPVSSKAMSGIGVGNVHRRLQLAYGAEYGLTLESEKGAYTKVTVRIPKER